MARADMAMIQTLDDLCRQFAPAFIALGLPAPSPMDVLDFVRRQEQARLMVLQRKLEATRNRPPRKALPLRDTSGYDYGRVTDDIPEDLYFNLRGRKDFGPDGLKSDEGRKDILKSFPQLRVETVSGKTTVGWTPRRTAKRRRKDGCNLRGANFNGLKIAA
jgi:hypothetical protein